MRALSRRGPQASSSLLLANVPDRLPHPPPGSTPRDAPSPLRPLAPLQVEMMRRATPKVLKSREAAEQLHCAAATHPSNSTRAAAARESDRLFASGVR